MAKKIEFENKFVAFLDVLGFSEKVLSKDVKTLQKYFDAIEKCFSQIEHKDEFDYIAISDSIIITAENEGDNLKKIIAVILYIQSKLAVEGVWLRGGLTYGEIYFDSRENVIVGKALIEAVKLEKQAIFPRVILSPSLVSHFSNGDYRKFINYCNNSRKLIHDYNVTNEYRITANDSIFISYACYNISQSLESDKNFVDSQLKMVFDSIRDGLFSEQSHYLKYRWLKDFFQESIMEFKLELPLKLTQGEPPKRAIFLNDANNYLGTFG